MAHVEDLSTSKYIIIVVNAFTAFTAIVFNSLTIQAIRKTPSLPKPLKTLLLSLAVSDVAVGLVAQPFFIVSLKISQETVPKMWLIQNVLADASFLGIVALSLERFLAVHLHLRYQELVTHKRVLGLTISAWVFSALLSFFCLWFDEELKKVIIIKIIIWSLCFIFITVISVRLYFTVRHHANQIQALQVQQAAQNGDLANALRLRKSAVSTFYVYFAFLACYLPFYCTLLAKEIFNWPSPTLKVFYKYSSTLMFINSSLNPVIYCWRMRDIRQSIKDILRNMFRRT